MADDWNQDSARRAEEARLAAEAAARMTQDPTPPQDPDWDATEINLDPEAGTIGAGSAADLASQRAATVTPPYAVGPQGGDEDWKQGTPGFMGATGANPPVPTPTLTRDQSQAVLDLQRSVRGKAAASQFTDPESVTDIPADAEFIPRGRARQNTQDARNQGTEIYLKRTKSKAIVRDLPFTDYIMLSGVPANLRAQIDASFKDSALQKLAATGVADVNGLEDSMSMWEKGIVMANAICLAAFVTPRLVQHESELDPNDPLVWLVDDVEVQDRLEVMAFCNRNRNKATMEQGGAVAVAGFPG